MRWTKREDGIVRTTVLLDLHVPKELVEWLVAHGETQVSAIRRVKQDALRLGDGWHTLLAYDEGDVQVVHVDDVAEEVRTEDAEAYAGPLPTVSGYSR